MSQPALTKQVNQLESQLTEPRWVVLPATHPLAARDQISFCQLWDEPFVAAPTETGWWRDYWLATDERQGHPVRIGAVTDQPDTWLTAIANGDGIALAPESELDIARDRRWCETGASGMS